jgi:hypothetical protein
MIILLVLAAGVVGAPIAAAVLVSLASRREDARRSLSGRAPNWVTRAARRLLSVQPRGSRRGQLSRIERSRVARSRVAPSRGAPMPAVPEQRIPNDEDISAWLTGPHV